MRRSTSLMAAWGVSILEGERLAFEKSKGGIFSSLDEFGLQVIGKTSLSGTPSAEVPAAIQCVKAGTKVLCRGKNLFNKKESRFAAIQNESAGEFWAANVFPSGYDLRRVFPEGETVTMSFDVECASVPEGYIQTDDGGRLGFCFLKAGIEVLVWTRISNGEKRHLSFTFTVPHDLEGETLRAYSTRYKGGTNGEQNKYGQIIFRNIQVELGSAETAYEPYTESEITTPCDLRKDDVWYPATGKVVRKTAERTLTAANSFTMHLFGGRTFFMTTLSDAPVGNNTFFGICDRFTTGDYYDVIKGLFDSKFISKVFDFAFDANSVEEMKAWLATHPIKLAYALGAPQTENYPPQPMTAPAGTVNVTSLPSELAPELSAAMLVKF